MIKSHDISIAKLKNQEIIYFINFSDLFNFEKILFVD
jgi:hypothetical protein